MKYFIDTEFIEGFHKPLFGKKRHFIDLISIAVVAEDGREYYAISNEFNPRLADQWVKDNVIARIDEPFYEAASNVQWEAGRAAIIKNEKERATKSNKLIAQELINFCAPEDNPQFYGYFADYDWVLLCSLFGRMIDLPKGFPMFCFDLKQMMEERGLTKAWKQAHCPEPENAHNALADARWNRNLYTTMIVLPKKF